MSVKEAPGVPVRGNTLVCGFATSLILPQRQVVHDMEIAKLVAYH